MRRYVNIQNPSENLENAQTDPKAVSSKNMLNSSFPQTDDELWNVGIHCVSAASHFTIAFLIFMDGVFDSQRLPIYSIRRGDPPYDEANITGKLWFELSPLLFIWVIEVVTCIFELSYVFMVVYGFYWKANQLKEWKRIRLNEWTQNPIRWFEYSITATLGTLSQAIGVGAITKINFVLFSACGIMMQFTGYLTESVDDLWCVNFPAFIIGTIIMASQIAVLSGGDDDDIDDSEFSDSSRIGCQYLPQIPETVSVSILDGQYLFDSTLDAGPENLNRALCLTEGTYRFVGIPSQHPLRIVSDFIKEENGSLDFFTGEVNYTVTSGFANAYYECQNHIEMKAEIKYFKDGCNPYETLVFDKWTENLIPYFVYYMSFAVNCAFYMFQRMKKKESKENIFPIVEFIYALLSLSSKIAIASLVYATVNQYLQHFAPCNSREVATYSIAEWDILRRVAMVLPGSVAIALGCIRVILYRARLKASQPSPRMSASTQSQDSGSKGIHL